MRLEMDLVYRLLLAALLGALIGLEREIKRKGAGIQTYSMVALGTCLFTVLAYQLTHIYAGQSSITFDPSRIIQAVAIGMGFIGAGVIFHRGPDVVGLTTAAGLWVTSAIGVAVGIGEYLLGIFVTGVILVILVVIGGIEKRLFIKKPKE